MPLCTLYLLQPQSSTSETPSPISSNLSTSSQDTSGVHPVVPLLCRSCQPFLVAKVVRWIIPPWHNDASTTTDISPSAASQIALLKTTPWEYCVVLPSTQSLPADVMRWIENIYVVQAGVPSRITRDFVTMNQALLHPKVQDIPALTGSVDLQHGPVTKERTETPMIASSTRDLEMDAELLDWIKMKTASPSSTFQGTSNSPNPESEYRATSMLNFLSFPSTLTDPKAKENYQVYGQSFATDIGRKRGGIAKIVGSVVGVSSSASSDGKTALENTGETQRTHAPAPIWQEIAIAHYPSLQHFADMISSKDYQDVNRQYRVPSLAGTGILCLDELDLDHLVLDQASGGATRSLHISAREGDSQAKAKL